MVLEQEPRTRRAGKLSDAGQGFTGPAIPRGCPTGVSAPEVFVNQMGLIYGRMLDEPWARPVAAGEWRLRLLPAACRQMLMRVLQARGLSSTIRFGSDDLLLTVRATTRLRNSRAYSRG